MTGFAAVPIPDNPSHSHVKWSGQSKILGPAWARMPTLTVGLLGVSVLWSIEMSYAPPYLLSLGLSKSWMAIVFLAGPLSGLIVQPLVGVLADTSRSRFGRRRPYMIGGSLLSLFAILVLGFARPVAGWFTRLGSHANSVLAILLAVGAIYCIDFSINAVQAVDRALLVDTLPASRQASGNAWAARMGGIGSVAGFYVGNVDLPRYFPFFGSEQLEVLSVIASLLVLGTHGWTAWRVKERILVGEAYVEGKGLRVELKAIFSNIRTLPRTIRQICIIQFFAWIGWFPVLFYTTVYIGELHKRSQPPPSPSSAAALEAESTRLGSRALLYSSLVSLVGNIVLPFFVKEAGSGARDGADGLKGVMSRMGWWKGRWKFHLASLWTASHLVFALCMGATLFMSSVGGATFVMAVTGFSWAVTVWAPFSLLAEVILSEPAAQNFEEIGSIRLADTRRRAREEEEQQFLVSEEEEEEADSDDGRSRSSSPDHGEETRLGKGRNSVMGNGEAQMSIVDVHASNGDMHQIGEENGADPDIERDARGGESNGNGLAAKAGIILGIHNIFIVIPQFLVTTMSSIIFAILDPEKSVLHGPGKLDNGTLMATRSRSTTVAEVLLRRDDKVVEALKGIDSVAVIFGIGGIAAAIAFVLSWRLANEIRHT